MYIVQKLGYDRSFQRDGTPGIVIQVLQKARSISVLETAFTHVDYLINCSNIER